MNTIKVIQESISKYNLDLSNFIVFTEAATNAYATTPIIAALAGAKVYAKPAGGEQEVLSLASEAGVTITMDPILSYISKADIITNSKPLRPIPVDKLKKGSVIATLFEEWEHREEDFKLTDADQHGIKYSFTDETGIIEKVGDLAIKLLEEKFSREEIQSEGVKVISDNKFNNIITTALNKTYGVDPNGKISIIAGNVSDIPSKHVVVWINGVMPHNLDYLDPSIVVELHTRGLKSALEMIKK